MKFILLSSETFLISKKQITLEARPVYLNLILNPKYFVTNQPQSVSKKPKYTSFCSNILGSDYFLLCSVANETSKGDVLLHHPLGEVAGAVRCGIKLG